jgi:hypothetical protein
MNDDIIIISFLTQALQHKNEILLGIRLLYKNNRRTMSETVEEYVERAINSLWMGKFVFVSLDGYKKGESVEDFFNRKRENGKKEICARKRDIMEIPFHM